MEHPKRIVACFIARRLFDQPPNGQPSNGGYAERGPARQEPLLYKRKDYSIHRGHVEGAVVVVGADHAHAGFPVSVGQVGVARLAGNEKRAIDDA